MCVQPVFRNPGHQISANFEPQAPLRTSAGGPVEVKEAVPVKSYMAPPAEATALPSARSGGSLSSVPQGSSWGPQQDVDGDDDATAL